MRDNQLKRQLNAVPIPSELRERSLLGIRQAAGEQQEIRRRSRNRLKRRASAIVAAAAILLMAALLLSQTKVWASIQKALQFVPGIGVVEEDAASSERYVLKQPISVKVGDGSVLITGFQTDEGMTYITMAGEDTPRFEEVTLVNEQLDSFSLQRSQSSWSLSKWTASFWHKGKLDLKGSIKLRMPLDPVVEVSIPLERAKSVAGYSELGETATVSGLPITAIVDRQGGKARVTLVTPQHKDFQVSDYGIYGVYMHDDSLKLHVMDNSGKQAAIEPIPGLSSPADEFYFPVSEQTGSYTLTLPEVSVTYNDETKIRVPMEPNEHLNQNIEIAGYPVTITKVERANDDPSLIRIYLDLHYDAQDESSLYDFRIAGRSQSAKLNERTGVMEYIAFHADPGIESMTLKLVQPAVVIRGPWTFHLTAEQLQEGGEP